jgi:hypothetical protein
MKQLIVAIVTILAILSNSIYANACPKGSGVWVLSTGESQCRGCPALIEVPTDSALKLPEGCSSPFAGALLDPDFYSDLKNARKFAQELESWRRNLAPTLDRLQDTIEETTLRLSEAAEYNHKLLIDYTALEAKEKRTSQMFWVSTIGGSAAVTVLTIILVVK